MSVSVPEESKVPDTELVPSSPLDEKSDHTAQSSAPSPTPFQQSRESGDPEEELAQSDQKHTEHDHEPPRAPSLAPLGDRLPAFLDGKTQSRESGDPEEELAQSDQKHTEHDHELPRAPSLAPLRDGLRAFLDRKTQSRESGDPEEELAQSDQKHMVPRSSRYAECREVMIERNRDCAWLIPKVFQGWMHLFTQFSEGLGGWEPLHLMISRTQKREEAVTLERGVVYVNNSKGGLHFRYNGGYFVMSHVRGSKKDELEVLCAPDKPKSEEIKYFKHLRNTTGLSDGIRTNKALDKNFPVYGCLERLCSEGCKDTPGRMHLCKAECGVCGQKCLSGCDGADITRNLSDYVFEKAEKGVVVQINWCFILRAHGNEKDEIINLDFTDTSINLPKPTVMPVYLRKWKPKTS